MVGVRLRLLESKGKAARAKLSAFRQFVTARQVNFLGETLSDLQVEQGKVAINMAANEWIEIEARW